MSESIASFVADGNSGKSATDTDTHSTGGNSDRTIDSQIINGYESEEPSTERIAGNADAGSGKRKRGRPPGSRNSTAQTGTKESVRLESLKISDLLYSVHLMGAEILSVRELELDKDECVKLADAIKDVSQYYVTALDPKKVAWAHLAVIAGGIYGTRIFAYRNRRAIERSAKPATPIVAKSTPTQTQKVNGVAATANSASEIAPEALWGMGGSAEL